MVKLAEDVDAFVRFEVSLLSGVSQTITCMPTEAWSWEVVLGCRHDEVDVVQGLVLLSHQLP